MEECPDYLPTFFYRLMHRPSSTWSYVRFGGEYWETYHRNMTRRRVLSLHNQIVKAINAHFSNVAIPHQIAMLEQRTRELKALSIEILNLAKQAKEWLRI